MTNTVDTAKMKGVREISRREWMEEGEKLFGSDMLDWRFVCANCGHVQSANDFKELFFLGIYKGTPDVAYYNCIGRYDKRIPRSKIGKVGDPKEYCNYTSGGLFLLHKVVVILDDGEKLPVFEFDESE